MQDINRDLISAVREGELESVRKLINSFGLSYYSPAWSKGYVLLCEALKNGHAAVAKLLLTSGARVNRKRNDVSYTALHLAVINGDIKILKMILEKGANIEAKDQYDRTPLYNAIENNKIKVTELLLKHNARVNVRDYDGTSPLHVAAEIGCLQIIDHLLKYGADINCVHTSTSALNKGYAPLHVAVENGSKEVIMLLLSRGAKVDNQDKDGRTVLNLTVNNESNRSSLEIAVCDYRKKYIKIVKALLDYGFNVNPKNANNPEFVHAAVEKGYLKIIDLFKYDSELYSYSLG